MLFRFLCSLLLLFTTCCTSLAQAQEDKNTIILSDAGWDSVKFHNAVAEYIGRTAFNLNFTTISGSTPIVQAALVRGDIDVNMETWTDNIPSFEADMKTGRLINLGINFDDDKQGFYVPRYVIEGDKARGIAPLAPDLKTVRDLAKYPQLFRDDENKNKGRIYGAIPGWAIDEIMYKKYIAYGLNRDFVYFRSGSEAALFTAFMAAYTKGEPIVGYCYEPTWISGKLDMVLLEDAPYSPEAFNAGLTEARGVPVCVVANVQLLEKSPEFAAFLKKYRTSSSLTAEALAYIADTKVDYPATAKWFLQNHPELLMKWLPADKADLVQKSLRSGEEAQTNWFFHFPDWRLDFTGPIDNFVKEVNAKYATFFNNIKGFLSWCISSIETLLNLIPWWLTILATAFAGKKLTKKWSNGIMYGLGLFLIGIFGYWNMMNETLAVVIAAVFISLMLGLPIGVLVSTSKLANRLLRPFLDAMQTMPTFVYMIPAVMLLGPGKVPAVLATVVYAVVPVIRLTSHGIQQVDEEIVEASLAYGASRWQTLFKVQIPQAMPTIMTGVNQTMMMAVAMVVTCAMIGANGLGMEVLIAINRTESGRGLIAGISIVIIAIIIDRLTQSLAHKKEG